MQYSKGRARGPKGAPRCAYMGLTAEAQSDTLVKPSGQVPAWEMSDSVAAELFPGRAAGQIQLVLLQHCEYDDVRTTIEEAVADAAYESFHPDQRDIIVPMDLLAMMDKMLTIQHVDLVMNKTV